ncbi:MAG: Asp-tRNA(Asn)/Glu-tRNA(Gln) amidotransferase subunit GatC [Candidatus Moranbacteria bacterium]|nr:Asp-tRNA(Asn)/Glu-tRNA(Gln) amidotransferase subunit GatC [Candidatus Moranbacteria bacterium]
MLSVDEVKNIAKLARIGLSDEDVPKYQKDLSAILDFFKELETVPTDGVLPMGNITGKSDAMREDVVSSVSDAERDAFLANMPAVKDGFVKVKSVF